MSSYAFYVAFLGKEKRRIPGDARMTVLSPIFLKTYVNCVTGQIDSVYYCVEAGYELRKTRSNSAFILLGPHYSNLE